MSATYEDWWNHWDEIVEADEQETTRQDAAVEKWLESDDESEVKPDSRPAETKESKPSVTDKAAPEPALSVPANEVNLALKVQRMLIDGAA